MFRVAVQRLYPAASAVARASQKRLPIPAATVLARNVQATATMDEEGRVWVDGKLFDPSMVTPTDPPIPHKPRDDDSYYMPDWIPTKSELHDMTPEEYEKAWVTYFEHKDCDRWMARKGLSNLHDFDAIPEPTVVCAALKCARRNDDPIFAIRVLEAIRYKCNLCGKDYWPYMWSEVSETYAELNLPTLEELRFDKPDPDKEIMRGQ